MPTSPPSHQARSLLPRLDYLHGDRGSADLVILAHGGQENSYARAHSRRPAALRMWPFVRAAHRGAPESSVALIRYRYRGWNGDRSHPLEDLREVLDALPTSVRRIVLVGHSMGGRTVVQCADDPRVRGVLALAPWLPDTDPVPTPASPSDTWIVTAHGAHDSVTSPRATTKFVRRLRESRIRAAEFLVHDDGHPLLERHGDWDELVRRFVATTLSTDSDPELVSARTIDPTRTPVELPRWSDRRGPTRAALSIARARMKLSGRRSIV